MTKAGSIDAANRDVFWRNPHEADAAAEKEPTKVVEAKTRASVGNAAAFSRDVWAKPAKSNDEVTLRAEICAYWTGGSLDKDGNLQLPDLKSKDFGRRAVAELIAAVLEQDR